MKTYKLAAGILAASIVMPSMALAASPGDLILSHWDNTGSATTTTTVTPLDYSDGFGSIPYFRGNGAGGGSYHFLDLGSGIGLAAGNLFVTPSSIETTDGHLSDTLGIIQSNIASLTSTLGGLGSFTQVQADYATTSTSSLAYIKNKPTLSPSYEGTTIRANSFPIFKSATVASGVAVVNLTADGTSGGTALCSGGVIQDSVSVIFNDAASSFQQGWAFTNSNKTLTVTANKFTSANILSGLLGQAAANGSVAKVSVWCYA